MPKMMDPMQQKKKQFFTLETLNGPETEKKITCFEKEHHLNQSFIFGLQHVDFQGCSRNIVRVQRLRYDSVLTKEVGIHSVIALATMFTKPCFGAMFFQQDSSDDISHFQIL